MRQHLRIWEISLLFALCVTLCAGVCARAEQEKLSGEVVRLHVIANSDSESDQAAKLKARDSVLETLSPLLEGVADIGEAENIIEEALPGISGAALRSLRESGKYYAAKAELCREEYPTRGYDGFALPVGGYVSLKVTLGEGKGHNWWCVVFPPLCMASAEDGDAFSALSESSEKLITCDGYEYRVKFRIVELYDRVKKALS